MKEILRHIRSYFYHIIYKGNGRYCPVCQRSSSKFGDAGLVPRHDARCYFCGSLERHRLVWLYFEKMTNLLDGHPKKMLHVAPEAVFAKLLATKLKEGYLTADLYDPKAMVKMDITDIHYDDASFDVIYCSHVLEHIPDDQKAMREFRRVLTEGGWAILQVPVTVKRTFEDPSVTDPVKRRELFGQEDHVRQYGPDFAERLLAAGFHVHTIYPSDFLSNKEITQMGITDAAGEIYYCTKTNNE